MYNVYYIGNNPTLEEALPFAQKVNSIKDINCATSMYWLVDSDVVVTNYDVFEFCNGLEYELDSFIDYVVSELDDKNKDL